MLSYEEEDYIIEYGMEMMKEEKEELNKEEEDYMIESGMEMMIKENKKYKNE